MKWFLAILFYYFLYSVLFYSIPFYSMLFYYYDILGCNNNWQMISFSASSTLKMEIQFIK